MADTLLAQYTDCNSGSAFDLVPANTAVITVLSISICNISATDADFDLYYRDASDSNFRIYNNQSVPSKSTFIHNSKIILPSQCELVLDQSTTSVDALHVVTSYLNQT